MINHVPHMRTVMRVHIGTGSGTRYFCFAFGEKSFENFLDEKTTIFSPQKFACSSSGASMKVFQAAKSRYRSIFLDDDILLW
jgi:ribose 5-phosphate isomerase